MGKITLLPKIPFSPDDRQSCLTDASLPLRYMSDYSVLGLLVDQYPQAVSLLGCHRFSLSTACGRTEVAIDNAAALKTMIGLFKTHGIDFTLSDIAAEIYQG